MSLRVILLTSSFFIGPLYAQDVAGNWAGTPPPDSPLAPFRRVQLSLSRDRNGQLHCKMFGGLNPAIDFSCTSITLTGSKLSLRAYLRGSSTPMPFVGVVSQDGSSIQAWFAGGPLRLERLSRVSSVRCFSNRAPGLPPKA